MRRAGAAATGRRPRNEASDLREAAVHLAVGTVDELA